MYERMYRSLYRIRRVEEEVARLYPTDRIKSPVHLSIGQEAVSVGVCEALRPDDVVFGSYRGHALYLAKGGDLKAMIAELFGRPGGCSRGKGGSMHLIDPEAGVMGTSAVVGTTIPNAVGYAYALQYRRTGVHRRQLLRRRRHGGRRLRREPELRGPQAAAGPVRLREQPLRHPHPPAPPTGDFGDLRSGHAPTAFPPNGSRTTTCWSCTGWRRRP